MDQRELKEALELHRKWLAGEEGGKRAVFKGMDLSRTDFSGMDLRKADFSHADLMCSNFSNADVGGARFIDANMDSADFSGAEVGGANFEGAVLFESNFTGANASASDSCTRFCGTDMEESTLTGMHINGAQFYYCKMGCSNLDGSVFVDVEFGNTNLSGATFKYARFEKCDFSELKIEASSIYNASDISETKFYRTSISFHNPFCIYENGGERCFDVPISDEVAEEIKRHKASDGQLGGRVFYKLLCKEILDFYDAMKTRDAREREHFQFL